MPADNQCQSCGQFSGGGHVCPSTNGEVGGGTAVLVDDRCDADGLDDETLDGVRTITWESPLIDTPIHVWGTDGDGHTTVTAGVHIDLVDQLGHWYDMPRDDAEKWLNDHQPEIDAHLTERYGVTVGDDTAEWENTSLSAFRSFQGDVSNAEAVDLMDRDRGLAGLHNSLNGAYQSPQFMVDLREGVEARRLVDEDGQLTDHARRPAAYNDSPLYKPVPELARKAPTISPPAHILGRDGGQVPFSDIDPTVEVAYNDAYANTLDSYHVAYSRLGDDWATAAIPDLTSRRVQTILRETDEGTRAFAMQARMQARSRARAAFHLVKSPHAGNNPMSTVTVSEVGREITMNRWRENIQGGWSGMTLSGRSVSFGVHDVVNYRRG